MTYYTSPLARYRFTFRVTELLRLPDYAGSTLRGAFGHALQQVSGVSHADRQQKNGLFLQSPYAIIFAPHDLPRSSASFTTIREIPVPYVIEAPLVPARLYKPDELFHFDMVLMREALEHLAIVVLAWRRALLRGIGKHDGKAELVKVEYCPGEGNKYPIYTEENPLITPHDSRIVCSEYLQAEDVHLRLLTPLRLQQRGKVLGAKDVSAGVFLRSLIRRVSFQMQLQNPEAYPLDEIRRLNALADAVEEDRRLVWRDWVRYSSRQQQKMTLGGVTGRWYLRQVPPELLPFIYIGQWLHVGKETMFGLGGYRRVKAPWQPVRIAESILSDSAGGANNHG